MRQGGAETRGKGVGARGRHGPITTFLIDRCSSPDRTKSEKRPRILVIAGGQAGTRSLLSRAQMSLIPFSPDTNASMLPNKFERATGPFETAFSRQKSMESREGSVCRPSPKMGMPMEPCGGEGQARDASHETSGASSEISRREDSPSPVGKGKSDGLGPGEGESRTEVGRGGAADACGPSAKVERLAAWHRGAES